MLTATVAAWFKTRDRKCLIVGSVKERRLHFIFRNDICQINTQVLIVVIVCVCVFPFSRSQRSSRWTLLLQTEGGLSKLLLPGRPSIIFTTRSCVNQRHSSFSFVVTFQLPAWKLSKVKSGPAHFPLSLAVSVFSANRYQWPFLPDKVDNGRVRLDLWCFHFTSMGSKFIEIGGLFREVISFPAKS